MVREELLRRQLLAAEDRLLAALKDGGLEGFLHQWASLQESIAAGAEQGQLSNELLLLNQSVCQDVADVVQSCLAVDEGIHEAFNAHDIHSDFSLSNEDQDVDADSELLRSGVPSDDGASAVPEKTSQHLEPGYRETFSRHEAVSEWDEEDTQDRGHASNFPDTSAWFEADLEDEDEDEDEDEFDEPDPDWDKMQDWFLANIAFPFLDPDSSDPILRFAPITPDHLEAWVSEICQMSNWHEIYSQYALNDRSRMQMLCHLAFGPKASRRSAGSPAITKKVKSALRTMRDKAIAACNYLIHARAQLSVDLEKMVDMLGQLPVVEELSDEILDEWSEADWNAWEADVIDRYNHLSLSSASSLEGQEGNSTNSLSCPELRDPSPTSIAYPKEDPARIKPACSNAIVARGPPEEEEEPITQEMCLPHSVPAIPCPTTGIKRKLAEFLAQFDTLDTEYPSSRQVLQPEPLDPLIHPPLEDALEGLHRSKRRRSHSPPARLLGGAAGSPETDVSSPPALSAPSPASPNALSPLSQSSPSSGSESSSPHCPSPPEDQPSPSEIQHCPSPTYSFSLPLPQKLNSLTPDCHIPGAVDNRTVSATSRSTTPSNHCLQVLSNNLTAYSSITHPLYKHHSTSGAKPYTITTTLFKSGSIESKEVITEQVNIASPGPHIQVQITSSESDQRDELPSKPPQDQVPVKRKRARIEFEVDLDCSETNLTPQSPITTTFLIYRRMYPSRRWSGRYNKSSKQAKKGEKTLLPSSPCRAPFGSSDALLHQPHAVPKRILDFQRPDLDKHDVRPTKRANLAPRDYSLSPDT